MIERWVKDIVISHEILLIRESLEYIIKGR